MPHSSHLVSRLGQWSSGPRLAFPGSPARTCRISWSTASTPLTAVRNVPHLPTPFPTGPVLPGSVIPSHPSLHNAVVGAPFRPRTRSPPRERVSLSCVRVPARTRHIPASSLIGRNLLRVAAIRASEAAPRERHCTRGRVCLECLASDRSPRRITTPTHRDRSEMATLISLRNESLATTFYSTRRARRLPHRQSRDGESWMMAVPRRVRYRPR
jgi:hypothetical protein